MDFEIHISTKHCTIQVNVFKSISAKQRMKKNVENYENFLDFFKLKLKKKLKF